MNDPKNITFTISDEAFAELATIHIEYLSDSRGLASFTMSGTPCDEQMSRAIIELFLGVAKMLGNAKPIALSDKGTS